ncbi:putative hydrolase of the HAD superfamily [Chitinophaga niastensis]|uniref:Putative hydrolase of the HAD superfamily n=1 Tax=Chitinophaga niastensis TaxID=536980 RepID=A0A2P8HMA0_CHINA|nr:HAD-IA family hydrolase [Chitinophaga niastensis]PSL47339.1 putative hydrolase of the HAD superfamily [Chitinophaga niastensis]
MNTYKHYSFDLWLTLIKSNPSFKQERTKFFFDHFNQHHKSIEAIALIFRQVDVMCNAINEKTGNNIDAEEMYLMVISAINDDHHSFRDIDLEKLYQDMEALVFKHLPVIYDAGTVDVLSKIKQSSGSTISLLSNTAFIKGRTLRVVLEKLGLNRFFDFQLYSDETGMSKPNERLFRLMLDNITASRNDEKINLTEIIHIGDNIKADIEGAKMIGINTLLINSNNQSILSLLN